MAALKASLEKRGAGAAPREAPAQEADTEPAKATGTGGKAHPRARSGARGRAASKK